MKLSIKDRAIIIYTLLWKNDSYCNLLNKETISNKIYFKSDELSKITINKGNNGIESATFDPSLDITAEQEYELTQDEISYLASKIIELDRRNDLIDDGIRLYTKVEEAYTKIKEEQGFIRTAPWQYKLVEQ